MTEVRLSREEQAEIHHESILLALVPHRWHEGVPSADNGTCARCIAERALAVTEGRLARAEAALRKVRYPTRPPRTEEAALVMLEVEKIATTYFETAYRKDGERAG